MKIKKIKNIVINYGNGETEVTEKGFVAYFNEIDNERVKVSYRMCNIKGSDLSLLVDSVMALAEKLGMLDEEERDVD